MPDCNQASKWTRLSNENTTTVSAWSRPGVRPPPRTVLSGGIPQPYASLHLQLRELRYRQVFERVGFLVVQKAANARD